MDISTIDPEFFDKIQDNIGNFFLKHTKKELYEEAGKRGIMLYPLLKIGEITQSPQLKARGYWQEVDHEEWGAKITYPGSFVRFSTYGAGIRHRAPLIGEHNLEIYEQELRLSRNEISVLKQANII
jgi:crotonobetainyl-CoA:carnitine CoA-transferase CaiB-like acyl-CoA transferase